MKRYDPERICDNLRAITGEATGAQKPASVGAQTPVSVGAQPPVSGRTQVAREFPSQYKTADETSATHNPPPPNGNSASWAIPIPPGPADLLVPDVMGHMEGSVHINQVPAGAPMRFVKRVIQRFLRIITGRQVDFNTNAAYAIRILTEYAESVNTSLHGIAGVVERDREALRAAVRDGEVRDQELRSAVAHLDAGLIREGGARDQQMRAANEAILAVDRASKNIDDEVRQVQARIKTLDETLDGLRASQRQMLGAIQDEMRQMTPAAAPSSQTASASPGAPARESRNLDDVAYRLYEDQWRGSAEGIAAAQEEYVSLLAPYLEKLGPERRETLDIGFGRGEFLRALQKRGLPALGVDINRSSVIEARQAGLQVEEADASEYLRSQPDNRFGAITAFQLVEHLSVDDVRDLARLIHAKLAPGGVALFETINPGTFAAFRWFYLDLTHTRLLPPESLRFVCECAGMAHIETRLIHPPADHERLAETGGDIERGNIGKLNAALFGPQDYFLLMRKPEV